MDERELLESARQGDDAAFAKLVQTYLPRVFAFTNRLLIDPALAEDASQETFIRAWKNFKKFDAARPFAPWLLAIAHNTALDLLRKKKPLSFSEYERPQDTGLAETIPDPEPLPDEVFSRKALADEVREALAQLPIRDRELLLLRYEEELSFEEIATLLGMPANTVRSIHRRALARLRSLLG